MDKGLRKAHRLEDREEPIVRQRGKGGLKVKEEARRILPSQGGGLHRLLQTHHILEDAPEVEEAPLVRTDQRREPRFKSKAKSASEEAITRVNQHQRASGLRREGSIRFLWKEDQQASIEITGAPAGVGRAVVQAERLHRPSSW